MPHHFAATLSTFYLSSLVWWRPLGYLFIFFGMLVEGDLVLFTAFFLTRQGFFDISDMVVTVFAGVLFGDVLWFWFGAWLAHSSSFAGRWSERLAKPFDGHIITRPLRTIFVSKFAYGVHHALLMRAGALGIPLRKFVTSDVISSFFWIGIVGGLGYFFSASYVLVRHYLRFVEGALLLGLVVFFALWHFVSLLSKKEL